MFFKWKIDAYEVYSTYYYLVVTESLKEVNILVDRIRAAIKFVRHSSLRLKKFKECVQREKIESKKLLCLDVSTR